MDLSRSPAASVLHKAWPVSGLIGYRPPAPKSPAPKSRREEWLATRPGQTIERFLRVLVGAWTGIALLTVIARSASFRAHDSPIVIGSFGAVMVVIYSAPAAPFAQPRNVIVGNTMAAIFGVSITKLYALNGAFVLGDVNNRLAWAAAATATAVATSFNELISCQHPPCGATALLAAILPEVHRLGYWYVGMICASASLMVGWACIVNNVFPSTRYPLYWLSPVLFADREEGTGQPKAKEQPAFDEEKRKPRFADAVSQSSVDWESSTAADSRSNSRSPMRSMLASIDQTGYRLKGTDPPV